MINSASFVANVIRIASGSFFGQLILIASSPLITRIYNPEVFGIFAIYNAIVRLISSVSPLRYEMAIIITKKKIDAKNLLFISISFVFISVLVFFQVINLISYLTIPSNLTDIITKYPAFICMGILFSGLLIVLVSWETRSSHFTNIGIFRALRPFFTSITQIAYGLFVKASIYGLFIGDILGLFFGFIFLSSAILKRAGSNFFQDISKSKSLELLGRYKNFPIYSTWSVFVNSLLIQLPVIILIHYFSASTAGYYALANRLLQTPMIVFNYSVGQVFLKDSTDTRVSGDIHLLVTKTLSRLIMIAIFPIIILALIGQDIFQLLFGSEWREAGLYVQVLSLWCFSAFIVSPLSHLINVYEKQNTGLLINIIRLIVRIGILIITAHLTNNPLITLILFSVSGFVTNMAFLLWLLKLSRASILKCLISFTKYGAIAAAFSVPLILPIWFFNISSHLKIIISVTLIIGYYLYILSIDSGLRVLLKKTLTTYN